MRLATSTTETLNDLTTDLVMANNNNNLMVDGETYECVKSCCYLGDTLDGDGGADLTATARIKNGWMKF